MPTHFTDIPYPAADTDAANKKYVDDQTGGGGGGGGIPAGGTTGQQLTKTSNVDFAVAWAAAGGGSGGGIVFQGINHQTGISYFVVVGDNQKLITLSNASDVAVTLPPPGVDYTLVEGFDIDHSLYTYLSYFTPGVGPPIGGLSGYHGLSQSFTPPVSAFLTKVSFFIRKHGSPTGTAVAKLYTHSGTYGTSSVPGTLLATSDTLDVSTVSSSGAFTNLFFSTTPYSMVSGTPYVITIESTAGDSSNYLEIPLGSGTYGGTWAAYDNGVWSPHGTGSFPSYDLTFAVFTDGFGIGDTWITYLENLGAGPVTIAAPFSAIDGIYSIQLRQDTGVIIASDGSEYYTCRGLPPATGFLDNDILGYRILGSTLITQTIGFSVVDATGSTILPNQRLHLVAVYLAVPQTLTGVKWFSISAGVYTAANNNKIGLYSYSGGTLTLIASSTDDGNLWKATSASIGSKAFSASYNASAGIYFVAMLCCFSAGSSTTIGCTQSNLAGTLVALDFTNSAKLTGFVNSITNLPSTQAMSGVTGGSILVPWVGVY